MGQKYTFFAIQRNYCTIDFAQDRLRLNNFK